MLSNHKAKVKHAFPSFKYCRKDVPASTMTSFVILFKRLKPDPCTICEASASSNFYHDTTQTCQREKNMVLDDYGTATWTRMLPNIVSRFSFLSSAGSTQLCNGTIFVTVRSRSAWHWLTDLTFMYFMPSIYVLMLSSRLVNSG